MIQEPDLFARTTQPALRQFRLNRLSIRLSVGSQHPRDDLFSAGSTDENVFFD